MSVSFHAYLIDIAKFRSVFGCCQSSVFEQVRKTIADSYLFQRDPEGDRELTLALRNFIEGKVEGVNQDVEKRDWLLLAMHGVCFAFGESLENEMLNCVDSDLLQELGKGADLLFNRGSPFPIDQLDLSGCMGYLTSPEVNDLRHEVSLLMEEFPEDGDPNVMETIDMVISWYDIAIESQNNLVGFWS